MPEGKSEISLDHDKSSAAKLQTGGRITIPKGLRQQIGLEPDLDGPTDAELVKVRFQGANSEEVATEFLEPTSGGRVSIPKGVREILELEKGDILRIEVEYPAHSE